MGRIPQEGLELRDPSRAHGQVRLPLGHDAGERFRTRLMVTQCGDLPDHRCEPPICSPSHGQDLPGEALPPRLPLGLEAGEPPLQG